MNGAGLRLALAKMVANCAGDSELRSFTHYYHQVEQGTTGLVAEADLEPLSDVDKLGQLDYSSDQLRDGLSGVAVIKLNGGLGTSMGLADAKTMLKVKDDLSFLDIIVRQVLGLRHRFGVELPLVFMNSFRTSKRTLELLRPYAELPVPGLPIEFWQSAIPKLRADNLAPVEWPADPELEWCPPGHGDLFRSLAATGILAELRARKIRYLFISNADNLGATCSAQIATWLTKNEIPYLAEVCDRTPADRKGGHLARRKSDGRLILRDNAMVAQADLDAFQDITRHRFFHTNNVWINVEVLSAMLDGGHGLLDLPLVVNRKLVDPRDGASEPIIQLETSMGTVIQNIEGAHALLVPRSRFRPVKNTSDLLVLRSDRFVLDADCQIEEVGEGATPVVSLDENYTLMSDFEARFPAGAPSLIGCRTLRVEGDVTFGPGAECKGDVRVRASRAVNVSERVLEGDVELG